VGTHGCDDDTCRKSKVHPLYHCSQVSCQQSMSSVLYPSFNGSPPSRKGEMCILNVWCISMHKRRAMVNQLTVPVITDGQPAMDIGGAGSKRPETLKCFDVASFDILFFDIASFSIVCFSLTSVDITVFDITLFNATWT
jgi:hypothetical protein